MNENMSKKNIKVELMWKLLRYCFLLCMAFIIIDVYRVARKERICTRFSARLTANQNEFVVALPAGAFHVQFTAEPNITTLLMVSKEHLLPARISSSIVRPDGSPFITRTEEEFISFRVEPADAYRPLRLLVSITKTNQCDIYMNLGSGI